jgi:hypothetical protein
MTNEFDQKFIRIDHQFKQIDDKFLNIDVRFDRLESKFDEVLEFLRSFKSETEEKFEFIIENAATKTELNQAITKLEAKMATKEDLLHFTDRFDAKFTDLRHDIVQGIRMADKKFLKFAI